METKSDAPETGTKAIEKVTSNGQVDDDFLTRDEILSAKDDQFAVVEVPEWGRREDGTPKKVRLKGMTATQRDAFESSLIVGSGKNQKISTLDIRAKLASLSIVDAAGVALFNMNDVMVLGQKSAAALDRIFAVAQKLSKITDDDVEELAGNSGLGLVVNSSSE